MEGYSDFWIYLFIFHVILVFFGLFSQNVFMKYIVLDKKIYFYGRVYLFFLSLSYQTILITFMAMTVICLKYGTMFEREQCKEARMIPLVLHNFAEFVVVIFHMLINFDRLILAFRPMRSRGRASKIYFYASICVSISLGVVYTEWAHYEDYRKSLALGAVCTVMVINLIIECKLVYYTPVVFVNTIGVVPLENRFELSTSVSMIKCFLPASACGLVFKFIVVLFYSVSYMLTEPEDIPPFYFVLNVFWNLDCALFPWFFIFFNPAKKQKLQKLFKIESAPASLAHQNHKNHSVQSQHEHFDQFRGLWKVEVL